MTIEDESVEAAAPMAAPVAAEPAIGDLLVERGKLDRAALQRAERLQQSSGDRLEELLPKLGLVSEGDVAETIAGRLGLTLIHADAYPTVPVLEDVLNPRFLRKARVLPLAEDDETVVLAMAYPHDSYAIDAVRLATGRRVEPRVGIPAELDAAIDRLYGEDRPGAGQPSDESGDLDPTLELDVERLKDLASEAPVIRLVNNLMARAVETRASDIHIEPFETRLRVRYRVDGVLREADEPPNRFRAAIVSRIKILARLNIAERRLPQDGRTKLVIRGVPIDLRVSIIPTMHGESVNIRILDSERAALDFDALGIDGANLQRYLDVLKQPHGIFLVTGPTGSGKTTTLYASLVQINSPDKKIITVEDPIEYQLEGINQIQVKPAIGLDFANILRSILRHDPDVILIGEIRDVETAQIAIQAALTGHLVLSTLHTNNAASAIARLLDMGVEDYLLTSSVIGVAAQRLVRTLCRHCREPHAAMPELVDQLGLRRYVPEGEITLYAAKGCDECSDTGFRGRMAIVETLMIDDEMRRLILRHASSSELQQAAIAAGMQTMFDDGVKKVLNGVTTVEDLLRVTRE